MPLIEAGTPEGDKLICLNEFEKPFGNVVCANTDEGWVEFLPLWAAGQTDLKEDKVIVDRKSQQILLVRLHTSYKLLDKVTGEVKYEVRWDLNGNKVK